MTELKDVGKAFLCIGILNLIMVTLYFLNDLKFAMGLFIGCTGLLLGAGFIFIIKDKLVGVNEE